MNNLQPIARFIKRLVFGVLFFITCIAQSQTAELSLIQVQMPDTVVLGETITVGAYLKNNSNANYTNSDLHLFYYINEIQDTTKNPVIQGEMIESTINLAMGDSVWIQQEIVVDELLTQIGTDQDIQKNIVIVWPIDDDYSIDYHLQPLIVLKQAIPEVVFNASPNFDKTEITDITELPSPIQDLIISEYPGFEIKKIEQQDFDDGSIQYMIELEDEDIKINLYFSEQGILVLVETKFDESTLLPNIVDFIDTKYSDPSFYIDSAYELVYNNGTVQYKVEVKDLDDVDFEEYFDSEGNSTTLGILLETYEEPDIEIGGIDLPETIEFEAELTVDGTLTNNLDVAYNDALIPINYASIAFPPNSVDFKFKTETSTIDEIQPQETLNFQQSFPVMDDLFFVGKNIVIVWPTDYLLGYRTNCIAQEIIVEVARGDTTVNIETVPMLANDIRLAPNPTLQHLNVITNQLEIEAITIYDMAAKPIEQYDAIRQDHFQTDVSHLHGGMYLLYIQTNEGNAVKKLMVGY